MFPLLLLLLYTPVVCALEVWEITLIAGSGSLALLLALYACTVMRMSIRMPRAPLDEVVVDPKKSGPKKPDPKKPDPKKPDPKKLDAKKPDAKKPEEPRKPEELKKSDTKKPEELKKSDAKKPDAKTFKSQEKARSSSRARR